MPRVQAGQLPGRASVAQAAMAKLKEAALDPYLSLYSHPRRHGCTKDVRELYLKTRSKVPANDKDLHDMAKVVEIVTKEGVTIAG